MISPAAGFGTCTNFVQSNEQSSNSGFEFVTYNSRGEEIVDPEVEAEAQRIANQKHLDSISAFGNPYLTYKDYNPGNAEDTGNIWGGLSAAERHMWQRVSAIRKAAYDEQHTDAVSDDNIYWHQPSTSTLPPASQRSYAIPPSPTKRPNTRRKGVTKRTRARSVPTMQHSPRPESSWQNHISPHPSHFYSGAGVMNSTVPPHRSPYPAPPLALYQNSPSFPYTQTSEPGPSQTAFGTPYNFVQHPYQHQTTPNPMQMDPQRLSDGQSNSMIPTDNLMSPFIYPNISYQPQQSWTENAVAYPTLETPHPSYVYPTSGRVYPQDESQEFQSGQWQEEPRLDYGKGVDYEYSTRERWSGD